MSIEEASDSKQVDKENDDITNIISQDDGVVELELDESEIVRYLKDDQGTSIGFVIIEEGEEVEYLFVDNDEEDISKTSLGTVHNTEGEILTKEGVAQATTDINAIYKDGVAVVSELKGALGDIKDAFSLGSFLKK